MSEYGESGFNPEEISVERAYKLLGLESDANANEIIAAYQQLEKQKFKGQSGDGPLISENQLEEFKQAKEIALKDFYGEDTKELDPDFPNRIQK